MLFEAVWQRLTLAQRATLRAVVLEDGRELLGADMRARHRLGGAVERPDVARRAAAPGPRHARGRSLRRGRLAAARVGRAEDVLMAGGWLSRTRPRTARSCAPGRCTTGPTRRSSAPIITAVFPIYFATVAAAGTRPTRWPRRASRSPRRSRSRSSRCWRRSSARIADYTGVKKRLLGVFLALGVDRHRCDVPHRHAATGCSRARAVHRSATSASTASFVFYDSLLPHIADAEEIDRVSTAGYALGYLGGGAPARAQPRVDPEAAHVRPPRTAGAASRAVVRQRRASGGSLFSIPLFRRVPEPPVRPSDPATPGIGPVRAAFARLGATFRELRRYRAGVPDAASRS